MSVNICLSNSISHYRLYTTNERHRDFKLGTTFDHCLTLKIYVFVTTLPDIAKNEDIINNSTPSETEVTQQHIPNLLIPDIKSHPGH